MLVFPTLPVGYGTHQYLIVSVWKNKWQTMQIFVEISEGIISQKGLSRSSQSSDAQ